MDLELLEARWRMGRLLTGELVVVARELLAAGHASPSLAALASSPAEGWADARSRFERALGELGRGSMSDADAALVLAHVHARALLSDEIPAELAVRGISALRWRGGPEVDGVLARFSELEARYGRASAAGPLGRLLERWLDRRARTEARRLLG